MDDSLVISDATRAEGFANQRLCVVPRPLVGRALATGATRHLVVTDAGFYPAAEGHLYRRPGGAHETIVLVCAQGTGWVQIDGLRRIVGPDRCIVIPAGTPHAYGASKDHPWTIWWCHLRGDDVPDLAREAVGGDFSSQPLTIHSLDRIVATFDEMIARLERGQTPAHLLAASGLAWNLLAQIAVDRTLLETDTALERAMHYLHERLDAQVSVNELATLVGLSSSHLTALFRRATGGGVTAYHIALRMSRARSLLDTTPLPIGQIAQIVGYSDPLYFSRQFRRVHGVSPTVYRGQRKG